MQPRHADIANHEAAIGAEKHPSLGSCPNATAIKTLQHQKRKRRTGSCESMIYCCYAPEHDGLLFWKIKQFQCSMSSDSQTAAFCEFAVLAPSQNAAASWQFPAMSMLSTDRLAQVSIDCCMPAICRLAAHHMPHDISDPMRDTLSQCPCHLTYRTFMTSLWLDGACNRTTAACAKGYFPASSGSRSCRRSGHPNG